METVEEYLRHAETSERLAQAAASEEHRALILRMAQMWRALAMDREKLSRAGDING